MRKDRSVIIVNTILAQILLIVIVNQQIMIMEDMNVLKQYLPFINLLVMILGIFSIFSITQIKENVSKEVEVSLIKNHLDQIEKLTEVLHMSTPVCF